jgi:hypothetical protein
MIASGLEVIILELNFIPILSQRGIILSYLFTKNFPFYSMRGTLKSTKKNCMVLKYEKFGWF